MKHISNSEFDALRDYMQRHFGIHLTEKKRTLVMSRLSKVLEDMNIDSYSAFMNKVESDMSGEAQSLLLDRLTTNHTFFYREMKHFEFFQMYILPQLEQANGRTKDLRIWSAGCSTGDEAYTLSMLMKEYFKNAWAHWNVNVLATDISRNVLETARQGKYDSEALKEMPKEWTRKYFFVNSDGTAQIKDEIRDNVTFRRFNLMSPFPFRRPFHVIFCRNVMIYFNQDTKLKLVNKFYDALEPGGYFIVGHSESIDLQRTRFRYVQPSVYRKD